MMQTASFHRMEKVAPSRLSILLTIIVALYPVASMYGTFISRISLADLFTIVVGSAMLVTHRGAATPSRNRMVFLPLLCYIVVISLLGALFATDSASTELLFRAASNSNDILIRTGRVLFFFAIVLLFGARLQMRLLGALVQIISVAASCFLLVQAVIYASSGRVLSGIIPGLPLQAGYYAERDYVTRFRETFPRPSSFFYEPAHFAQYACLGLILVLHGGAISFRRCIFALSISLAVLISTSVQGLLLLAIIWAVFASSVMRTSIIGFAILVGALAAFIAVLGGANWQPSIVLDALSRVDGGLSGRTRGYAEIVQDKDVMRQFFGAGFGTTEAGVWYSSLAFYAKGLGFLGVLMAAFALTTVFKEGSRTVRLIVAIFAMLTVTSDIFHTYWIVLFLSLALYYDAYAGKGSVSSARLPNYRHRGIGLRPVPGTSPDFNQSSSRAGLAK